MYKKFVNMLNLVFDMQGSIEGVSYKDIQDKYGVSRRTAERMVKAISESFLDVESISNRPKRWRLKRSIAPPDFNSVELSVLNTASKMFKENQMALYAQETDKLLDRLRADFGADHMKKIESDLDALNESEAFVFRPGPREQISPETLHTLRHAIMACRKVRFDYTTRTQHQVTLAVEPYAFLHATRHYLIAFNPEEYANDFRTYIIKNIENLEELENEMFVRDEDFTIEKYLSDCFRVFHEKPYKVVWRFTEEVADEVSGWNFHHSQNMQRRDDGSLDVTFTACGLSEMAWHLVTWGDKVKVIEPEELIEELENTLEKVIKSSDLFKDKDQEQEQDQEQAQDQENSTEL